ncbi:MAG: epsilon-lactone hydrolase [Solirubrobacteraceae bacterium]|nr:epsilon-lactone hydrolase [Solirubrobacteraceae bacterium]
MTPSRPSRILAFLLFWFIRPLLVLVARGPRVVPPVRRFINRLSVAPERGTVVTDGPGGEWVRGPGVAEGGDQAILYLHGSGYVVCSPGTHRGLVAQLSKRAGMPAFSVDYRLAPEHPFPAAFDDMVAAYRYLLDEGYAGKNIVVAGDSAGGHLAISLVAALTEAELPVPAGLILFSPLVDPSFETAAKIEREARDPAFTAKVAKRFLKLYTDGGTPDDARLAVISGDSALMPPVLLHAGSREMLRADADALAEWLAHENIHCDYTVWEGQIHVFQMFYAWLPEARAALREAGDFARSCVSARTVA